MSRTSNDIETNEIIQDDDSKGVEPHVLTAPIPGGRRRYIQSPFHFRPLPEGIPVITEEDDRLMKEAKTLNHLLAHLPKNKFCPFCVVGKMVKDKCLSQVSDVQQKPFGTNATGDYFIRESCIGYEGSKSAMVVYDLGTTWSDCFASANKDVEEAVWAMNQFAGDFAKNSCYSECAGELIRSARRMGWMHNTAVPHHSKTDGRVEREVRIEEGTRTLLMRAGLDPTGGPSRYGCFASAITLDVGANAHTLVNSAFDIPLTD